MRAKVLSVVGSLRSDGRAEARALLLLHAVLSVTTVSISARISLHGPAINSLSPSQPKETNIARLLLYCCSCSVNCKHL